MQRGKIKKEQLMLMELQLSFEKKILTYKLAEKCQNEESCC